MWFRVKRDARVIGDKPGGMPKDFWFVFQHERKKKPSGFSKLKRALDAEISALRKSSGEMNAQVDLHDLRRTGLFFDGRAKIPSDPRGESCSATSLGAFAKHRST